MLNLRHRPTFSIRLALTLFLICAANWSAPPAQSQAAPQLSGITRGPLTRDQRIQYQRALEAVYWRHRTWPDHNRRPKPALDDVLPPSAIAAKVDDYLAESEALELYWQRPITDAQLQAEMDRMARQTHDAAMLRELWAALGNDPYAIAECLARPSLANRLIRHWYAYDAGFHSALKRRAESDVLTHRAASQLPAMSGEYRESTVRLPLLDKDEANADEDVVDDVVKDVGDGVVIMGSGLWTEQRSQLAQLFGTADRLPTNQVSRLAEDQDRFYVLAVLEQSGTNITVATMEWRKEPFDAWWNRTRPDRATAAIRRTFPRDVDMPVAPPRYRLPRLASSPSACVTDTWTPIQPPTPTARNVHSAVWTGSEMIIWGGGNGNTDFNTGGRYSPATDTWTPTSTTNAPRGRGGHTAVWTGTEMIVWGSATDGGRYDPATDRWSATSTVNAPSLRSLHTAVWTGGEMIVWGGYTLTSINTGGRYDPASDTWVPTSQTNAPNVRSTHTAVWTGSEMIVWGGSDVDGVGPQDTGGRYDPATDTWRATSVINAPTPREGHTAVWTGTEMIVWGGEDRNTGGRYDPVTDTWTPTTSTNAPDARSSHTAVWTGDRMIVWGGVVGFPAVAMNTGGGYDPATDTWTAIDAARAPTERSLHTAVWTGTEMIVWGGADGTISGTGGRYNPATDTWIPTAATDVPSARGHATTVWTGSEMIVWGGLPITNTGSRYDPATDGWTATSTTDAPSARSGHTAIWTGREMIVWGGANRVILTTGGRYDPTTDAWVPTSTTDAPFAFSHTAVWTGSEMLVWSGEFRLTGGRYDPGSDTWAAMNTIDAPSARTGQTAIWTGNEMIIWGGYNPQFGRENTGARFDPVADRWQATDTVQAPSPRALHTAIWTGTQMIVWGGGDVTAANSGGRYDPATDTWTPTALTNAPSGRGGHTAVWTNGEMIVWGGSAGASIALATGGRYDPAADTWTATATTNAPMARIGHGAVWTGNEMIVWGGTGDGGGRYCASR